VRKKKEKKEKEKDVDLRGARFAAKVKLALLRQ
jgi:hypothetical protein